MEKKEGSASGKHSPNAESKHKRHGSGDGGMHNFSFDSLLSQAEGEKKSDTSVRLIFMSDTHGGHREIPQLSASDHSYSSTLSPASPTYIMLHSGDFSRKYRTETADDFNDWMGGDDNLLIKSIPKEHKLVILGNHEEDGSPKFPQNIPFQPNFTFLFNQMTQITVDLGDKVKGVLNIFGSRYHLPMVGTKEWDAYLALLPQADIILTHSPARMNDRMYSPQLVAALEKLPPPPHLKRRIHCSGHAHERHFVEYDKVRKDGMVWVGAAMLHRNFDTNEDYMAPPRFLNLTVADFVSAKLLSK